MTNFSKLFWQASLQDIKRGYTYEPPSEDFVCLICGEHFTDGRIYQINGALFEAEKAVKTHIAGEHSVFEFLLGLNKKYTGLTEHQKELLTCFYRGLSDKEIAAKMENNNTSTVRNQRFSFREKAKQAKVFLTIMELLEENSIKDDRFIEIPPTIMMVDERFAITEKENEEIIKAYFKEGKDGPLSNFPTKEKRRVAILKHLLARFDLRRKYTEKEVNEILKQAYDDYVTLRRSMIEYGFMERYPDGSFYWVKS
ncbi:MAG: DUF2087 domain-containing protein [Bacillota bacterium]